ncbi:MAG: TolB protein [Chloroflexota bacterium]|jgi:Tol biopolymer transport system component|nr:TolB protein [Chloroflexota bacterium]
MTSEHRLESLVADALRSSAPNADPSLVPDILDAARKVRRHPRWLALLTERPMRRYPDVLVGSPTARIASALLATLLMVALGALALVAGGILPKPNLAVVVQPSNAVIQQTPSLAVSTAAPTDPPQLARGGLIAYAVATQRSGCDALLPSDCRRSDVWVSNADGSGAYRLFPDDDHGGFVLGWSSDGTGLLSSGSQGSPGLVLTNATGSVRQTIDKNLLCPIPCTGGFGVALSPDATRIAFVRNYGNDHGATVVAILDLATGKVTELDATRTTNPTQECAKSTRCQGMDEVEEWSPDGRRVLYARQTMSPEAGSPWTTGAVMVIDADGTNLERLTPKGMHAYAASWSPDGTSIAFVNDQTIMNAAGTEPTDEKYDVYTVRADGTGLLRLTDDGASFLPRWTRDGRITFARGQQTWVMASDGQGQTKIGSTFGELTAAGCAVCMNPLSATPSALDLAFWQPLP